MYVQLWLGELQRIAACDAMVACPANTALVATGVCGGQWQWYH
jgi:hypothetical protein